MRNGEAFLPHLVRSVSSQSLDEYEWLVINDASTDGTSSALKRLGTLDGRLRVIDNPNPGRGRALRLAVTESSSPLLAIWDVDDLCFPWRLQWQWEDMTRYPPSAAIGYGFFTSAFDPSYSPVDSGSHLAPIASEGLCVETRTMERVNQLLKRGMPFGHSSCVLRKEAILTAGNYDVQRIGQYDYSLLIRMAVLGMAILRSDCSVGVRQSSGVQHFENGHRTYRLAALRTQAEALRKIPGPSLLHVPYLARTAAPLLIPKKMTRWLRARNRELSE